jgi:hypothetical protein
MPQSHAIARIMLLGCVLVHRLIFFTSKDDLKSAYPSLRHFRKAASERFSFHATLLQIVQAIKYNTLLPAVISPSLSPVITGARTRAKDNRTKEVAWGTTSLGSTPHGLVKKFYTTINPSKPAKAHAFAQMIRCNKVPVYRVNMETKSNKGAGSQSRCVKCSRLTNIFCIICKKWLCDPQFAANRSEINNDDPKYIKITFDNGQ